MSRKKNLIALIPIRMTDTSPFGINQLFIAMSMTVHIRRVEIVDIRCLLAIKYALSIFTDTCTMHQSLSLSL